jgi:hypothetical protein
MWERKQNAAETDTATVTVEFAGIIELPCRTGVADGHHRCCRWTIQVIQMDNTGAADGQYR